MVRICRKMSTSIQFTIQSLTVESFENTRLETEVSQTIFYLLNDT